MTAPNPDIIHTLPVDDVIEHEEIGDGCPCGPIVLSLSTQRTKEDQ
jgi:hypothetical protein